jgi:DNA-directed RNA polymerase subunit N (RpoN/RPB10)
MKVNCLSCGHSLDLHDAYDNYRGQIRCFICGALLNLRAEEGQVLSVVVARTSLEAATCAAEQPS